MNNQKNNTQLLNDEFTRIFDAYRAKINEITRRTQGNPQPFNASPESPPAITPQKPEETIPQARQPAETKPEANGSPVKIELQVVKESDLIIKEAKRKAQQIIAEAEEDIKKEAKKRTQTQVDKIISKAQKDAEDIVNQAVQAVDKERTEAVTLIRQESERFSREIKEKCLRDIHAQSSQIIAETQEKAANMIAEIVTSGTEIVRQIEEITGLAKKTITELETKLQPETRELIKEAITETQDKILQITMASREEYPKTELSDKNKELDKSLTLAVHLVHDKSNGKNPGNGLFKGQVELKSLSPAFNYQYLKNIKKYLIDIPGIKYLQESVSERGMSLVVDFKEPLPLAEILNHIPLVDKVFSVTDDDICLIFTNTD